MEEKTYVDDIDRSIYDIKNDEKDVYRIQEGLAPEIVTFSYISDIFRSIHKDKFRTILQIPERCFQRFSSQVDGDSLIVLCLNHE